MDPISNIILGALGNALYDISKESGQRLGRPSKRYQHLNALRWERLPEELKKQIERYRLQTSQVGLIEIGKALHEVLENDENLAADVQQLLTSNDDLKEIFNIGFSQLGSGQQEIKQLIEENAQSAITLNIHQHLDPIRIDPTSLLPLLVPFIELAAKALNERLTPIYKALATPTEAAFDKATIENASLEYAKNYEDRHGHVKILEMREPIPLEGVYVAVQFLADSQINPYLSREGLEQTYRESAERRFQMSNQKQSGISVANETQYLMVLGGPGVGKTTFLRKVGLEALKGGDGDFAHDRIPVFIELRRFGDQQIDIYAAITREFRICGFLNAEMVTKATLESGRLLVLLDGLDEIPTANLDTAIDHIQDFVDTHRNNRFIASCRIAAYKSRFRQFTDVEIADFDDDQIKSYIYNWFASNRDPKKVELDKEMETAQRCWQTLNEPRHSPTKELAQNPLLLTLLCMVYEYSQTFSTSRAGLYREALDVLLKEWAAEKRIQRDPIYTDLNIDLEKIMLSKIAHQNFEANQLFFEERDVVEQIKAFLADNLNAPKHLDGEQVLEAIAIQQGILVERVQNVYSFSHLTFQEYLTANYIDDQNLIGESVTNYLTEDRWWEVFLLLAGLVRGGADRFLLEMQAQACKLINTPKLKNLLRWADGIIDRSESSIKSFAKHAIAMMHASEYAKADADARARAYTSPRARAYAIARADARTDAYAYARANAAADAKARAYAIARADARTYTSPRTRARAYAKAYAKAYAAADARAFASVNTNRNYSFNIFKGIDFAPLIEKLDILEKQKQFKRESFDAMIQAWRDALNLTDDMIDLSVEEWQALADYLQANELIIKCKEAAVRVSPNVWQEIEAGLLRVGE